MTKANIKTLTSLRFFAAAMVVVGHIAGNYGIPSDWAANFPHYLGVSFFFVLSGFILTITYPEFQDGRAKVSYLMARFARVWPLHAFAFFLICLLRFMTIDGFGSFMVSTQGIFTAALNLSLLQAWVPYSFYNLSFNAVSWSISVEAFFYLSFLWLIRLRNSRWYLLPAVGLLPAVFMICLAHLLRIPKYAPDYQTVSMDMLLYIHPASRLFEFTLGMATACMFAKYMKAKINFLVGSFLELFGVGLFLVSVLVLNYKTFEIGPLSEIFSPAVCIWLERCGASPPFAVIIFIFAFQSGLISRFLQQRFYVVAGEISYAVYMLHPIIQTWVATKVSAPLSVVSILYVALVLWGAYLAWRYIETPARQWIKDRASGLSQHYVFSVATDAPFVEKT